MQTHTNSEKERKWPPDSDRECAKGIFPVLLNINAFYPKRQCTCGEVCGHYLKHCLQGAKSTSVDEVFLVLLVGEDQHTELCI